jgi:Domain of unknown function (DUF5916)/Carbohydrate family 9 binding domain-like
MRVSAWAAATLAWILLAAGACFADLSADLSAEALSAQAEGQRAESEPAAADKAGKELHALRILPNTASIRVDGRVDDEAWMRAQVISDLTQEDPDNMMPPTESTAVRVAYDDRYLYIAVQMLMRDVSQLRDGLGRRGSAPPSDRVFIAFDTAHDHQNAYVFEANASGVQNDYLQVNDTETNNDYEAVWEVATVQTGQGWNAEFRIPFSQMRFPAQPGNQTVWGFNIRREVFARGEQDWWVAKARGAQGVVSRFGHLIFDDRLTPPRRLEFTPYVLGQLQTKNNEAASGVGNAGFDLRVGLGPSASLSATVNPDFGQVEADPSVLNLSVFETFFPEKRPFFLEDSQTFVLQFGQFPDFYSRRIGQQPNHFELADNETLVTKPDTTTIFGAVKLTGKTSRWNYGALTAVTSREHGSVDVAADAASGATLTRRERKLIEPRSLYSVARVSRNLLGDTSNVGLIATNVTRELDADASLAGVDATLRRDRNRFNLNGHVVATHAPIDGVVRNGFGGVVNSEYTTKYYNVNGHLDRFSPSFRNSDMGFFFARPNKNEAAGGVWLYQPDPKGLIRNSSINLYGGRQWNDDHLRIGGWEGLNGNVNFMNFWHLFVGLSRRPSRYDDVDTRGGPTILFPANSFVNVRVDSDSRKQWGGGLRFFAYHDNAGGYATQIESNARLQPSQQLVASVGVELTSSRDSAQWIKNTDADHDGIDDNVYGTMRRHEINITTRATYSFTRDMTLEAYVQPFVAVGNYFDIRKLARPKSYEFTPVTLADDPDFNKKSVRGTIVLRWEYVRGSTLFAVWNLSTSDEDARKGMYSPWRDLRGAFGAPGTNTFAIKLSYWFAP